MTKIFFSGSVRGGAADCALYGDIVSMLSTFGTVLSEHNPTVSISKTSDSESHDRDIQWILTADSIVAECTVPSIGVGYEIGRAIGMGKKVICIHRPNGRKLSAMITGNSAVISISYRDVSELSGLLAPLLGPPIL